MSSLEPVIIRLWTFGRRAPNKSVEPTAAPLCSFGASSSSDVAGFVMASGRAAVAHLWRWSSRAHVLTPTNSCQVLLSCHRIQSSQNSVQRHVLRRGLLATSISGARLAGFVGFQSLLQFIDLDRKLLVLMHHAGKSRRPI